MPGFTSSDVVQTRASVHVTCSVRSRLLRWAGGGGACGASYAPRSTQPSVTLTLRLLKKSWAAAAALGICRMYHTRGGCLACMGLDAQVAQEADDWSSCNPIVALAGCVAMQLRGHVALCVRAWALPSCWLNDRSGGLNYRSGGRIVGSKGSCAGIAREFVLHHQADFTCLQLEGAG